MFMLVEDQYGVGDIIDVGEASGVVEAVGLRTTRLRDVNGTVWYVPNGQIARVGNKSQEWSRALLDVTVAYDADVREAEQAIKEVADEMWNDAEWRLRLLEEPEIWGVEKLGPSGIDIRVVIKTKPAEQFAVMRELRTRIKEALDVRTTSGMPMQWPVWVRDDGRRRPTVRDRSAPSPAEPRGFSRRGERRPLARRRARSRARRCVPPRRRRASRLERGELRVRSR